METVGLTYRGRQLIMDPDFQIDWSVEDDLMNPLNLGQGFSASIQIPIKGNEWVFGFASNPATSTNNFKTYDGFAITVGGNIWWECSFDLQGTSEINYEGSLSTISSAIFESKSKSIAEILEGVNFSYPSGGYPTVYAHFNGSTNRGIRFPWVHYYGQFLNHPITGDKIDIINKDIYASPFFHLDHIVSLVLSQLGYTVNYNLVNTDFKKVLINTPRTFGIYSDGDSLEYSQFLPSLTLSDLLLELAFYTSGKITVDQDNRQIYVESLSYSIARNSRINIAEQLSPVGLPSRNNFKNVIAEYAYDSDTILASNPLSLSGVEKGPFADKQSYALSSSPSEGDYAYCRAENAYYKWINVDDTLRLEYYCHPFLEVKTGTEELIPFSSKLSPVSRTRYTYAEFEVDAEIVEYDGGNATYLNKAVLRGFEDSSIVLDYDYVGIMEFKKREKLSDTTKAIVTSKPRARYTGGERLASETASYRYGLPQQSSIGRSRTAKNSSGYYIGSKEVAMYPTYISTVANEISGTPEDTSFITTIAYVADADVSKIKVAKQHSYFMAMIGKSLYKTSNTDSSSTDNSQDTTGSVALWQGEQFQFNASDLYPYAAPDNYYYNTSVGETTLDTYSLNLSAGTNLIWTALFYPFYELIKEMRIVRLTGYLSSRDLRNLYLFKTARFQKGLFRFKSFRTLLTRRGIRNQEIEGYRL